MKTRFLPAFFKKIGYISLIVAVSAYFINISGILTACFSAFQGILGPYFAFKTLFEQISLCIFLFSIFSIGFSADPKGHVSTRNRLLLPHYFKIIGYTFLAITLCFYLLFITKHANASRSETTSWEAEERWDHHQAKLSAQQKKAYLNMEPTAKKTIQINITTNPISLLLPVGLLFLAFSKEKVEDELITSYRAQSLQLAILLLFFLILYQKLYVPEVALIVKGKNDLAILTCPDRPGQLMC